jgi:hypothetical protein
MALTLAEKPIPEMLLHSVFWWKSSVLLLKRLYSVPFLILVLSNSSKNYFPFRLVQDRLFNRDSFSLKTEKRASLGRNPESPRTVFVIFSSHNMEQMELKQLA